MKKNAVLTLSLVLLLITLLTACTQDRPPDSSTPAPAAYDGVFAGSYGTLYFNGDGQSIALRVTPELAERTGLPTGENKGTYVFLFHNESIRYDLAEYFRITIDGTSYQFNSVRGRNDPQTVAFYSVNDESEMLVFDKQEE